MSTSTSEELAWVAQLGEWGTGIIGSITQAEDEISLLEDEIKAAKENMHIEIEKAKQNARDRFEDARKTARETIKKRKKFLETVARRVEKEAPMLFTEEEIARARENASCPAAAPVPSVFPAGE